MTTTKIREQTFGEKVAEWLMLGVLYGSVGLIWIIGAIIAYFVLSWLFLHGLKGIWELIKNISITIWNGKQ